jgi:hypothetical protein
LKQTHLQHELLISMPSFLFAASTAVGNNDSLLLTTSAAAVIDWLQAAAGSTHQELK